MKHLVALAALLFLAASCDRSPPATADVAPTIAVEQEERRASTATRVQQLGFDIVLANHWMPPATLEPRESAEVADRAIAAMLTAIKGERGDQALVEEGVAAFGSRAAFSPRERAFIENPEPEMQARADFSWRFECVHVLLWALGYVDELHGPATAADIGTEVTLIQEAGATFGEDAAPRSADEILAEADFYEGVLGASRQLRANGQELPETVSYSIVYERTRAFRWLVRFGETWDEVTLAGVPFN